MKQRTVSRVAWALWVVAVFGTVAGVMIGATNDPAFDLVIVAAVLVAQGMEASGQERRGHRKILIMRPRQRFARCVRPRERFRPGRHGRILVGPAEAGHYVLKL